MKYKYEEIKSKTIIIKFIEDEDEIIEYMIINSVEDYCELCDRLDEICEILIKQIYEKDPNFKYEDLKDNLELDYYYL